MTPYAEVIGDPIAQSKSPLIHGFWLKALGIDAEYRATHVTPEGLADYFATRAADPAWRGCNITLPHKIAALDHVDDRGSVRDSIGAINTVIRGEDGALIGTNTDAGGFYAPIAGLELEGQHAVVIGAGGAARAILFALSRVGIGRVTILNRNVLKAAALLARFGIKGDAVPLGSPLPPAELLVNASALGMVGQPPLDLDLSPLPGDAVVYDAVYAPLETDLLAQARERDLDTVDGLEMLVGQAALAFEMFFGAEPPRDGDDELRALLTA
ncbi:shikimate dehydrogenase [Sphingomonas xinjiangensis]|uniref:Shikimate dehydrogenase (NADP(+)) n=1 Tax=Sphingomonas xinjiangensis TaxID=643568 RepID=A0A840YE52_9SPHN|nr:shikimate dehydrogenase [Sphingomonas xinjiangensis]MBB5711124.1 shikimate dehydrogenase [Sphingomonas xinjiangensis]